MLALYFVVTNVLLAFAVRLFERPYYEDPETGRVAKTDQTYQDYNLYSNSLWLVTVTITTVGYGDFFPRTHLGRICIILACFIGVFIVSLTIVTLKKSSEFNYGEQATYDILLRLKIMKKVKLLASKVIYYNIRFWFLKHKSLDKQNIEHWTEYKSVRENKVRSQQLFKAKRKMLFKRETVDKIDLDYNNMKQKFSVAQDLDKAIDKLLEVQTNTKE